MMIIKRAPDWGGPTEYWDREYWLLHPFNHDDWERFTASGMIPAKVAELKAERAQKPAIALN